MIQFKLTGKLTMCKRKEDKMNKHLRALICLALIFALTAAGCSESGDNTDSTDTAPGNQSADSAQTQAPDNTADSPYGTIKTVETPDGFTGNTGEVKIESGDTYAVIKIEGYEGEIKIKLFPEAAPEGVKNFIDSANSGYYTGKDIHRVVEDFMMQGGSANGDGRSTEDDPQFYVEYNAKMRHFYGALCYANAGGVNGRQFYIVNSKNYSPVTADVYEYSINEADYYISVFEEMMKTATDEEKEICKLRINQYKSQKGSAQSSIRALEENTQEITDKYDQVGGTPYLDGGYTVFGQTVSGFEIIDAISGVEVEPQSGANEISHPVEKILIESITIHTAE